MVEYKETNMSIYEKLYDWQKNIVDKYKSRYTFGLYLDMGLGKTPLSLAFAEVNQCTKLLIVSINPKVLEDKEIKDSWLGWTFQSSITYNYSIKNKYSFDINQNDVFLVNYESLYSHKQNKYHTIELSDSIKAFIKSCKGHRVAIIIDESHKIKSLHSKQTIAINKIQSQLEVKASRVYSYLVEHLLQLAILIYIHNLNFLVMKKQKKISLNNFV